MQSSATLTLEELDTFEINVPSILAVDGTRFAVMQSPVTAYNMVRAACLQCAQRFDRTRLLHDDIHSAIGQILAALTQHNTEAHSV